MRLDIDLTQDKKVKNVFFTSDFHLFHTNVLRFDNRPFKDVHEMHDVIENNWNSVVGPDDIVIYVGDLSFAKKQDRDYVDGLIWRLNGKIHFIMGNHDDFREVKKNTRFESVQDYIELRITDYAIKGNNSQTLSRNETMFCCMHYPILEWNKLHRGSYMIHGHTHMNLFNNDKAWFSEMETFKEHIPTELLDKYNTLIKDKYYYDKRVFDVGCMGYDYKPVSYLEILKLGETRVDGSHH